MIARLLSLRIMVSLVSLLSLVGLLQSCAGSATELTQADPDPLPRLNLTGPDNFFGDRPRIPSPDQLHRLTPEQQRDFMDYYSHGDRADIPGHRRMADYLQEVTRDFRYDGVTLDAATTLREGRGNCLSLAILTTALARLAGVEIGYQLMDDEPVFEFNGNVISKGVHVRSVLYKPDWERPSGNVVYIRPHIKVDYFPTQRASYISNLSEQGYYAMYYRNIAAAGIADSHHDEAWWYARQALTHAPRDSEALNMLAVILRRTGQLAESEALYRYGIDHASENLSLLKNYHFLLSESGRTREARRINTRLMTMDDPSPFHWFHLAQSYYREEGYTSAIRYYREALERAPYLHQAYLGIARSYYQMGQTGNAQYALSMALDNARKVSTQSRYQEKLMALRR